MKVVVLAGGGFASAVVLSEAVNRFGARNVRCVTATAKPAAPGEARIRDLCRTLGIVQTRLPLPSGRGMHPAAYRIGLIVALGVAHAYTVDANEVWTGHHSGHAPDTPDRRPEYLDAAAYAVAQGTAGAVAVVAPFLAFDAVQIAGIARRLEVPLDLTWSCTGDGVHHCGVCMPCVRRRAALKAARTPDPTTYEVAP